MLVTVPHDSGNAVLVDVGEREARIKIRAEPGGARQWFHLRVSEVPSGARLQILDADACSFPRAWNGFAAVGSSDQITWPRLPTRYESGTLTIDLPAGDVCWVAAFAPYPGHRHNRLIARAAAAGARLDVLGTTLDGAPLDRLRFGDGPRQVWVVARQHAGEAMAAWSAEGLVQRLMDPHDAAVARLLEAATVHVVPSANPDGVRRGHLRGNALGVDLNRSWHEPSLDRAPEVLAIRTAMDEVGVSLCVDVHGDEALPHCFAVTAGATPNWDPHRAETTEQLLTHWQLINPDFEVGVGYPPVPKGRANLTLCTNQVAERFRAVALTVEQPFKDHARRPDPEYGWSPARSRHLGASLVDAVAPVLERLR